jgi:hypothetical protein
MAVDVTYTAPSGGTVYAGRVAPSGNPFAQLVGALDSMSGNLSAGAAAPAPSLPAGIVQYLTHDGDAVGNVTTSSAPNRLYWNTVLEVPWARGTLGDWRDSADVANGSTPYASFPAVTATGRRTLAVTALVQRWRSNGLNRGFFLSSRANAFPLIFAGRTATTAGDRPELVVVTTSGTFNLAARANACWNSSSVSVVSSAAQFELRAGQQPAILQFDLSTVTGTVTSATLGITLTTLTQTGAIIDVFEADPPALFDPAVPVGAVQGIGGLGNFAALQAHPDVLFAKDFATGSGQIDTSLWPQAITRTVDANRGTTYASSFIAVGTLAGADSRVNIVNSTVAGGVTNPAQRRDSAHATIRFRMAANFAGLTDRVKIPAMGSQLGWWNSSGAGYWQPVTGNGGFPGTGLKVVNASAGNRIEYHGHSSRLTTGHRCSDVSAYGDYVRLATYIYHLDQVGAFPTEDTIPGLVLKRGTWYDMSHYLQLNTMSGAQDGLGNYDTANADGIYRLWINGQQVLNRTNYRWRRHAEFCVQGFWVDVYHGGTNPADRRMDFDVNELAIASSYIGPVRPPVQISSGAWTPNVTGLSVLDTDWTQLPVNQTLWVNTNTLDDVIPTPRLGNKRGNSDGSPAIVNAWSGAAVDWINGRMYITGGGHADSHTCENGIYKLDSATMRFSVAAPRSALPGRRWRSTTDTAPYPANDGSTKAWFDLSGPTDPWNDSAVEPQGLGAAAQPPASHTFWQLDWVPPSVMGNADGAVINHFYTKGLWNATTQQWDTPHYNFYGDGIDFSYSVIFTDGLKVFQPYGDFVMRAWDYSQREATLWSTQLGGGATSRGVPLVPTTPANSGGFFHGNRIVRNQLAVLRMPERRQVVSFGVQSEVAAAAFHRRLRLGQAVDATTTYNGSTSWAGYFDSLTLTSADGSHNDFNTQANFADLNAPSVPSHLFAAGCVWDEATATAWVWGNNTGSDLYRLAGLGSSNTVTTERLPTTARPLSSSFNGTFGRAMLVRRGGATCIVRVNSTLERAQIVRVA